MLVWMFVLVLVSLWVFVVVAVMALCVADGAHDGITAAVIVHNKPSLLDKGKH